MFENGCGSISFSPEINIRVRKKKNINKVMPEGLTKSPILENMKIFEMLMGVHGFFLGGMYVRLFVCE